MTHEAICKAEEMIQMERTNIWTPSGGKGEDILGEWG